MSTPLDAPRASVIIPAHDEGGVIDRCLEALDEDARAGRLEVVVAANGCTDDTVERARRHTGVQVLDLPAPSKVQAINAADAVATAFPRIYLDADIVLDMRFLPNPFWVPELRSKTGRDPEVAGFVFDQLGADEFVERAVAMMDAMISGYVREGRRYVTLAVGCTGGKHRSVAVAERLSRELSGPEVGTITVHRDLGRE